MQGTMQCAPTCVWAAVMPACPPPWARLSRSPVGHLPSRSRCSRPSRSVAAGGPPPLWPGPPQRPVWSCGWWLCGAPGRQSPAWTGELCWLSFMMIMRGARETISDLNRGIMLAVFYDYYVGSQGSPAWTGVLCGLSLMLAWTGVLCWLSFMMIMWGARETISGLNRGITLAVFYAE